MEILLQEYYKADLHVERFIDRKLFLEEKSYEICGITQSGKTKLAKSYLITLPKKNYLYLDCSDTRIEPKKLNETLQKFCTANSITTLVLDNYNPLFEIVNVSQLIVIVQTPLELDFLESFWVYPLDYEEFLAYEHKFDSTALNHYLQLGSLPVMHTIYATKRVTFIQQQLQRVLSQLEYTILGFIAQNNTNTLSAFGIYERLKQKQKISKNSTYQAFGNLIKRKYIFALEKFSQPKGVKKLYLGDIFFQTALTTDKHFGKLFENMVFLELVKHNKSCYYYDGVDFYLPKEDTIILCKAFTDERVLFKKLESIEAFLFSYNITKIVAITMSKEGKLSHPLCDVTMVPFDIWAVEE